MLTNVYLQVLKLIFVSHTLSFRLSVFPPKAFVLDADILCEGHFSIYRVKNQVTKILGTLFPMEQTIS